MVAGALAGSLSWKSIDTEVEISSDIFKTPATPSCPQGKHNPRRKVIDHQRLHAPYKLKQDHKAEGASSKPPYMRM